MLIGYRTNEAELTGWRYIIRATFVILAGHSDGWPALRCRRVIDLPPHPSALFGSLRGVGYPIPASIADLIDNCISAGATEVRVAFIWAGGASRILIADDGNGMAQSTLIEAMRLGGQGPQVKRQPHDLGRFGMGLKTASLAHCQRLTVCSKSRTNEPAMARWDLAEIARHGKWSLDLSDAAMWPSEAQWLKSGGQGTIISWDDLDRIVPTDCRAENTRIKEDFIRIAEDVSNHCGMVFHRFISDGRLRILIGSDLESGTPCKAWDPMLEAHPDIRPNPEDHLEGGVKLQGFVLPRPDRFETERDLIHAGGPEGWVAQQGLYVYRGDRLLLSGGWMGLREGRKAWTRDPSTQLARIRIEFPSSADAEWALDISKRHARIPDRHRSKILKLAGYVRGKAKAAWFARHTKTAAENTTLWQRGFLPGDPWKLNRDHPTIAAIKEILADASPLLTELLTLIERGQPQTTPVVTPTENTASTSTPSNTGVASPDDIAFMITLIHRFKERGLTKEMAMQRTMAMDPYGSVPDQVRKNCNEIFL